MATQRPAQVEAEEGTALTPREVMDALRSLYGPKPWRLRNEPLTELVETILSQNTSDVNSHRAFAQLWTRFGSWEAIAAAPEEAIEEAIRIGGLSRIKAARIKAVLAEIERRRGSWDLSFLREWPLEEAKAWLRSLPGVGPKTAACVLLFAIGLPALPVDTHVYRVAKRLGLIPSRATAEQAHALLEKLLAPEEVYEFHMLLIEHGRRTCKAGRPRCEACPLNQRCPSSFMRSQAAAAP